MTETRLALTVEEAKRVANASFHCLSNDITREALKGLTLEFDNKGALVAIATDGHRLAHIAVNYEPANFTGDKEFSCIWPKELLEWIMKLKTHRSESGNFMIFTIDAEKVQVRYDQQSIAFNLVKGKYGWQIIWDKACANCRKEPEAFFNIAYINDIAKAVKNFSGVAGRVGFVFAAKEPAKEPMIVETPDEGIHYLLMPMR